MKILWLLWMVLVHILIETVSSQGHLGKIGTPISNNVVDIGFLLDGASGNEADFKKIKSFVNKIAASFHIATNAARVGVVLASDDSSVEIKLSDHHDLYSFQNSVNKLQLFGGKIEVNRAFEVTNNKLFIELNGARQGVRKILLVLFHGNQLGFNIDHVKESLQSLQDEGTKIFFVAITDKEEVHLLNDVTGSESNVFLVNNYEGLVSDNFINRVTIEMRKVLPVLKCHQKMDIGFLLDSSASLKNDYSKAKDFIKSFGNSLDISVDGTHVALITFSLYAVVSIRFSDYMNGQEFFDSVDRIPFMGSTSRIDRALSLAGKELFSSNYGGREDVPKVLVLITDGAQTIGPGSVDPGIEAKKLREGDITIMVIGIGNEINKKELMHIAGQQGNLFLSKDFNVLRSGSFVEKFSSTVCSKGAFLSGRYNVLSDIVFVVDSSQNVVDDYNILKGFLIKVISHFKSVGEKTKFSLILSGESAKKILSFSDVHTLESYSDEIHNMPLIGDAMAKILPAFEMAYRMLSSQNTHDRANVPKAIVLLTSSFIEDNGQMEALARKLNQLGVSLFSIGVGANVNTGFLTKLSASNVKVIPSFDDLKTTSVITDISRSIYQATDSRCYAQVDIGFLLDSSGSLRKSYYKEKELLKSIARKFLIGPNKARLSVITFSNYADHTIKFSDLHSETSFFYAVDKIPLMGSTTRIDKALILAKNEMFTTENGARQGIRKLLIVITDGSQTPGVNTKDPAGIADELRSNGVNLLVAGIGNEVNETELQQIAGKKENIFLPKSFDEAISEKFIQNISRETCNKAIIRPSCDSIVDVGFILDSSGSLKNDYSKEKDFLKVLAGTFGVSAQGSRAGVITFSYYTEHSIKLNDHTDLSSFNAAVDKIPLMGSTTRIDKALRLTKKEMFSPANGGRTNVPKVLILLTDGSQTQDVGAEDPGDVADELRKDGINILVVGIGSGVNATELAHIAGGAANSYTAASFQQLLDSDFVKKIRSDSCKAAVIRPSCDSIVDVGFILDSSGSLKNDYSKEKDFLKVLAGTFGVSAQGSRAGVITFSYYSKHSIKLNDHTDLSSFSAAVDKIPLMGSTTRIDKALRLTKKEMFSPANGGRTNVPKVLILLTDGSQTQDVGAEDPGDVADELRKDGINILVVGIGSGVNATELAHIAGGAANSYTASSFQQLVTSEFVSVITQQGCQSVPGRLKPNETICQIENALLSASNMVKSNMEPGWIRKYLTKTGSLSRMIRYHKKLNFVMDRLQPTTVNNCQSQTTQSILTDIFSNDEGTQNSFDTIRENNAGYFVDLLWASGLAQNLLSSGDKHTYIVPSVESFKKVSKQVQHKLKNTCYLRKVLRYHISKGNKYFPLVKQSDHIVSLDNNKHVLQFNDDGVKTIGTAGVLIENITAKDGVVHLVNKLLLPPEQTTKSLVSTQ